MRDVDEELKLARRNERIGEFVAAIDEGQGVGNLEGGVVTGLTIRMPTEEDPGALIVVRATGVSGKKVAFVGAYRLGDAILAWRAKSGAGKMKWRPDLPWEERGV